MANYEVTILARVTVVVTNADGDQQAIDYALDRGDVRGRYVIESSARLIQDSTDLDQSIRHADHFSSP